ncbi:MAG: RnfABCDGE type electron transport complex subunit B [Endomicrobiia bacterium]|nr:RnfABCDGE type electron transport complex subunit B [Endomicrobiia bacterium]
MSDIVGGLVFLSGIGFLMGFGLAFAAKKFAVSVNPVEEEIIKLLPGANCGACGYAGCAGYAEALIAGLVEAGKCPVADPETNKKISAALGKELTQNARRTAIIFCGGGSKCRDKYEYDGIEDCAVSDGIFGGPKSCEYGCVGLGNCARICPFGAIDYVKGEVPVIAEAKCTSCGLCVAACPKKIIHLVECKYRYHIQCSSTDKGARVRQICPPGCIGCGICVKLCPQNDIILSNNLARMKYDACDNCGVCEVKCPTKTIVRAKQIQNADNF